VDAVPTIEITTPARETLRDRRGVVVGTIERQSLTGKVIARDARGVVVGSYDLKAHLTRDSHGKVIGRGNFLGTLLVQVPR
jgi:hypothetical protein